MARFSGRVVAITGAAGNLGRAVAGRFAREGGSLVLLDVDAGRVASLAKELPGTHRGLGVDLLDTAATRRSEEHTSELQSLMRISYAVFCLKKKTSTTKTKTI